MCKSSGPKYWKYLEGAAPSDKEKDKYFLKLELCGPFNIFNRGHVFHFGLLVMAITRQQEADIKASATTLTSSPLKRPHEP